MKTTGATEIETSKYITTTKVLVVVSDHVILRSTIVWMFVSLMLTLQDVYKVYFHKMFSF